MAQSKMTGVLVNGSLKGLGVSFYTRNGKTIMRPAHTEQPRRNSRGQFAARMRMRHTTELWKELRKCDPLFAGGKSVYARFASLANTLPAVFVSRRGPQSDATLLLPGMPVSDGTLPVVKQRLGEVDGTPALITDLVASELQRGEVLRLYTLHQTVEGERPRVRITFRDVTTDETVLVDGCIALKDNAFADNMTGWALVRIDGDRCSPQVAVTRCTNYEPYTTEEAMLAAAESYCGLTGK